MDSILRNASLGTIARGFFVYVGVLPTLRHLHLFLVDAFVAKFYSCLGIPVTRRYAAYTFDWFRSASTFWF